MCFTSIARKINIFERDAKELTRADVLMTYCFLLSSLAILIWYSYKYYELAKANMSHCEETKHKNVCLKNDFIHLGVPYIGILNGFFIAFYKGFNLLSIFINYLCCCFFCCSTKKNANEITIDMNNLHT